VGAFVGTFLGRALGLYSPGEAAGWIMSLIGAVIVLAIYRMVVGRRGPVT
ncbi:MAG: putative rane protein, partial [Geminicoccaceae bacterium]|nr:putative rane protein [Geminicoccaceae bacterium]